MAYSLRIMDKHESEIKETVMYYARMFKLLDELEYTPEELSMSELKRLMIASVLSAGCEVVILDEPLTGMTCVETAGILNVLKSLTGRGMQ